MDRYTETDLLKMAIEAEPFFTDSTKPAFRNIINKVPAVDAVEVVRCKDCKHWAHGDCYRLELSRPNDFCSYGERRADNGTT